MNPPNPVTCGKARLFTMGVYPLKNAPWLWPDAAIETDLAQKDHLFTTRRDAVFADTPQSLDAQLETLELILSHCLSQHPDLYHRDDNYIRVGDRAVNIADDALPPLWRAARLVQEDLVLMLPEPDGWVMRAASLSFPSSWRLREKMGLRLDDIHADVPGFGPVTRNAGIMARMFDNLHADTPVLRWNYSLNGDPALYHPHAERSPRFGIGANGDIWLRMERQTLRKLPRTGAILFTIRILHQTVDSPELANALIPQIEALSNDERAYKGLIADFDDLMRRLKSF